MTLINIVASAVKAVETSVAEAVVKALELERVEEAPPFPVSPWLHKDSSKVDLGMKVNIQHLL